MKLKLSFLLSLRNEMEKREVKSRSLHQKFHFWKTAELVMACLPGSHPFSLLSFLHQLSLIKKK